MSQTDKDFEARFAQVDFDRRVEQLEDQVETMAKRLERAAEELRREGETLVKNPDHGMAVDRLTRANWMVNSLNFVMPNLNPQDLLTKAHALDEAEATLEATTAETEED